MTSTIMSLLIFNAFLFTQMTHPMSMGMILLTQTLLTCLITGTLAKNFWFSYILFLIFIGGMLILFIYMASLASNEKFTFSVKNYIGFWMLMISITLLIILDNFFILPSYYNMEINALNNFSILLKENFLTLSKMYDLPNNYLVIFMIIYLLLNLVIIVKITNMFNGPLRSKN